MIASLLVVVRYFEYKMTLMRDYGVPRFLPAFVLISLAVPSAGGTPGSPGAEAIREGLQTVVRLDIEGHTVELRRTTCFSFCTFIISL